MLKIFTRINVLLVIGFLAVGSIVTSCDDEEDLSSEIKLNSFGPSPALRGGDIKFIGTNLDQVTSIVLPGNVEVSDFKEHSAGLIVLTVPEETIEGVVMLKTPQGDIISKSPLGISEPIALTTISPAEARPGDVVTLTGTYLNLIEKVIFSSGQEVTAFESQSKTTLAVKVPEGAQTGIITLVAALEEDAPEDAEPIVIESEEELMVVLPVISGMSPATVKAGSSLSITGTDLALVKQISFTGAGTVTEFEVNEAGDIIVTVPADAKDGKITVFPASSVAVESATDLVMMVPTITAVAPNPVKPGTDITVTGTNLDLITSVVFGGETEGTIVAEGRTAESFVVSVPKEATAGAVTFNTAAGKSVTSEDLAVINPAITGISPLEIKRNANITITGTNLDLVNKVSFVGGVDGVIVSEGRTAEKLEVTVPTGSESGKISLTAVNGNETVSTQELIILASNVPVVTSMPSSAKPGEMITIEGEKLNLATEVIFPGGVKATTFGEKSATKLEVVVPASTTKGDGKITFVTVEGESTESPALSFQGTDPVVDESLVFFNFNGKDSWWGDIAAPNVQNEEAISLNGTKYFRSNETVDGYTGLFFRNSKDNFPADVIGTNISDYVVKFDINVLEPITGGEMRLRFKENDTNDYYAPWKPWATSGSFETEGWITVTIPLTSFKDNYGSGTNGLTDMSVITQDFGFTYDGSTKLNVAIDNVRFEKIN